MDKNTITGFILIAAVIIGYSWWQQPSAEELEAMRKQDSINLVAQKEAEKKQQLAAQAEQTRKQKAIEAAQQDTTALFYQALSGSASKIVLKNEKVEITLNTQGGTIEKAVVKDFKDCNGNKDVTLFDKDGQQLKFMMAGKNTNIITSDLFFTPSNVTDSTVTMTAVAGAGQQLVMNYTLGKDYMLHMSLQAEGMAGLFAPNYSQMDIEWNQQCRQQERGYTFENQRSALTYHFVDGGTDYLNETKEYKDKEVKEAIDWVAFKNQYFSAVMIAKDGYAENALMTSLPQKKETRILKEYEAKLKTAFDPTGKKPSEFEFYIGPNDFRLLQRVEKQSTFGKNLQLERLVYLGWPLIRIINRWFTLYVFDWLTKLGLNMGIVLILIVHHLPAGEEELYEFCQDACAEAETRRGHEAVRQARRSDDETAGHDADVLEIWSESVEWLSAHAHPDAYLDCHVQLRAERHPAAWRELPLDERPEYVRPYPAVEQGYLADWRPPFSYMYSVLRG